MNEEEKNNLSGSQPAGSPAENAVEQAETARQKAMRRARDRKPDREFADDDDEALYGAMMDDSDEDARELEGLRKRRDDMNQFLKTDGRSAEFLSTWNRTGSPTPALVRQYGKDVVADLTNPEIQDAIETENQEYLKRMAENEELDRLYDENVVASREIVNKLKESGQYSEEDVDKAVESLTQKFLDWLVGKVSEEAIVAEIKASGYDAATEQAMRNGRVQGRNENIKKEFDRRARRGDGVPSLEGGGDNNTESKSMGNGALDRASRASIWD